MYINTRNTEKTNTSYTQYIIHCIFCYLYYYSINTCIHFVVSGLKIPLAFVDWSNVRYWGFCSRILFLAQPAFGQLWILHSFVFFLQHIFLLTARTHPLIINSQQKHLSHEDMAVTPIFNSGRCFLYFSQFLFKYYSCTNIRKKNWKKSNTEKHTE